MTERMSRNDLIPGTDDSNKRRNVLLARLKVLKIFAEQEMDVNSKKVLKVFQEACQTFDENTKRIDEKYSF